MKRLAIWMIVTLAVLAGMVVLRDRGERVPGIYRYDVSAYRAEAASRFRQTARLPLALLEPRGVAAAGERLAVVGDRALIVLDGAGVEHVRVDVGEEPRSVAADAMRIVVAAGSRLRVYDWQGRLGAAWESLGENAILTGLATMDGEVFVADCGQRTVWRLDSGGRLLGRIGTDADDAFVIPSPSFDVAARDGRVAVTNPGRQRVQVYRPGGERVAVWGRSGMALDAFCGCCNPTHLAWLPDGRTVTSEKGLPRVKVYGADGAFEGLVAGEDAFAEGAGLDLAVDGAGRIVVLDAVARSLKVYEEVSP